MSDEWFFVSEPLPQSNLAVKELGGVCCYQHRHTHKKKPRHRAGFSSEGDGTRTRNHRIDSQRGEHPNPQQNADIRDIPPAPAAPIAAPAAEPPLPPDLAALLAAWPALPTAVRAGILAMVQASASAR
jgi:hypothetical protein